MQQHGSNYFACRPSNPWVGIKSEQIQLFSEYCPVIYQIKGNGACSIIAANIFSCRPTLYLTLGVELKGHNSTLPENGNVAYQIKCNHECSNMLANIVPT